MLSNPDQCNNVRNIYAELLKSDKSEDFILIELANLQYKCVN